MAVVIAVIAAVLAFLPLANRMSNGAAAPWFPALLSYWGWGTILVGGAALVIALLSRNIDSLWPVTLVSGLRTFFIGSPTRTVLLIAALAGACYLAVSLITFGGRPLHIDELAQLQQARIFASGALWRSAPAHPEFFGSMHMIDSLGRVYSQYPAGGPALLALGVLAHAAWAVVPMCGVIGVLAFAAYLRIAEPRSGVGLLATALFAFAPFVIFMSGTELNHGPLLMWVAIAIACVARVVASAEPLPWWAFACGLAFGAAATVRPGDAVAFAVPAAVWFLARAVKDRARWTDVLCAGAGLALPLAILLWVNLRTTGAPLRFGYEVMWGPGQAPGFHVDPFGDPHTPMRGLRFISLYFMRLQMYVFEAPIPSLLPAILALALAIRLDAFDRYLLAASGLLVLLYFGYFFDGFYPGPRYVYPLMLPIALWTARLPRIVRDRFASPLPYRGVAYGYLLAGGMALAGGVPSRVHQYAGMLPPMRWNPDAASASTGVHDALVFVRVSWGAEIIVRLWALGVPRGIVEQLYRHVDSCLLDQTATRLERTGVRGSAAADALRPLLRDSARVAPSTVSPDHSERVEENATYTPGCVSHIRDDRRGFTVYPPVLLAEKGNNVWAYDLRGRDTLLLAQYPSRPVYLLSPESADASARLRFLPLSRDSLWQSARRGD